MNEMTTTYDAMPLGMYCRVLDVLEDTKRDDLMTQVGLIAALCNCSEQEVLDLPVPEFSDRAHRLGFLETPPPHSVPDALPERITLNGHEYEVHADPMEVNTAQYVDYQTFIQQGRAGWPGIVSLMLIPPGKAYGHTGPGDPLAYDAAKVRADIASYMPVTQANALAAFFQRRHLRLMSSSLTSLRREVQRMPEGKERTAAEQNLRRAWEALEAIRVMTDSSRPSAGSTPSSK
jgi:hypothetical protein